MKELEVALPFLAPDQDQPVVVRRSHDPGVAVIIRQEGFVSRVLRVLELDLAQVLLPIAQIAHPQMTARRRAE